MEFDNQQQIWQRVRSPEPPRVGPDLHALVLAAGETEAALGRAAGYLGGSQRQQVLSLAREAAAEVAALRGIHWLSAGKDLPRKPLPAPGGNARELLRLCYFRCLKAQGEYTARTLEPQFGGCFQLLAQQNQARCLTIARILGTWEDRR